MLDKLNKNLSLIIYRYKWQLLINKLNNEYQKHIFIGSTSRVAIALYNKRNIPTFGSNINPHNGVSINYRFSDMSAYVSMNFINTINLQKCKKLETIYKISDNYEYTSTKYLQEIKERGIECLIK